MNKSSFRLTQENNRYSEVNKQELNIFWSLVGLMASEKDINYSCLSENYLFNIAAAPFKHDIFAPLQRAYSNKVYDVWVIICNHPQIYDTLIFTAFCLLYSFCYMRDSTPFDLHSAT